MTTRLPRLPHHAWALLRDTYRGFSRDHGSLMAAALSFYSLVSVAPLLILTLTIAGPLVRGGDAGSQLVRSFRPILGQDAADFLRHLLAEANLAPSRGWATAAGIAVVVYGASRVFVEMQRSLGIVWHGVGGSHRLRMSALVGRQLVSFLMVLGAGLLGLAGLVASTAISAVAAWMQHRVPHGLGVARAIHLSASLVLLSATIMIIYRLVPRARLRWSDVALGALLTAIMTTLGQRAFGWYLGRTSWTSIYGAAGTVVILLFWFYYAWVIFLAGAEFTKAWAERFGSKRRIL